MNTFPPVSTGCAADRVEVDLNSREWMTYWGSNVDDTFNTNEYLIFYITIAPNAATADLPNLNHDYLFVQGAYNYRINSGASWSPATRKSNEYTPQPLATSATISTLTSNPNRGGPTELSFTLSNLQTNLGPANNGYLLLAEFLGSGSWLGAS
jgi:hypothetical protein